LRSRRQIPAHVNSPKESDISEVTIGLGIACTLRAMSAQNGKAGCLTSDSSDYRIRFIRRHGLPTEERSIGAESVAAAVSLAAEIAAALEAVDFSITPLPPKVVEKPRHGVG
jgi:hypothetical protein